ncbi:MAG: dual specificity protein phosphatase family protein [Planctomycetes bacterium]|nr:dual specificity protein phosphatase family protein [Planctomycetota bacterium]
MRRVEPHPVWIGHAGELRTPRLHAEHGIVALVDLAVDEAPFVPPREMVIHRIPLLDGAGNEAWILEHALRTVSGLVRSGTPTLVACSAGMSRSPSVVAASIALATGQEPQEVLARIAADESTDVSGLLWEKICAVVMAMRSFRPAHGQ